MLFQWKKLSRSQKKKLLSVTNFFVLLSESGGVRLLLKKAVEELKTNFEKLKNDEIFVLTEPSKVFSNTNTMIKKVESQVK